MNQWVAVDGGQSGLRLRVLPDDRTGSGPGFRYQGSDVASGLVAAVEQAAAEAGVRGEIAVLLAGLSGLPVEPSGLRTLASALSDRVHARRVLLTTDVVTAHAGALPDGVGVVLAAGTGVVCLGLDPAGRAHRTDGWGHLFGDAGSAFDIGREAMSAVQRAHDGRAEATELRQAALRWFGVEPERLPQRLYRSENVVADVAGFAPAVVACADAGDEVARRILRRAGQELARTAAAALSGLDFGGEDVPIARVGRLWEAGAALTEPFEQELARLEPRLSLAEPAGDALAGAARLARSGPGRYRAMVSEYVAEEPRGRHDHVPASRPSDTSPHAARSLSGLSSSVLSSPRASSRTSSRGKSSSVPPFPRGALIVSCQAQPDSPLYGPEPMAAMARAAIAGGATGIRVNGEADIAAVRSVVEQPVIGLLKQGSRTGVYITPTVSAAEAVVRAGADIVALDGTPRQRLDGASVAEQIAAVHRLGALVMADVDSLAAGIAARESGADMVATSLAGYTGDGQPPDEPDLALLAALVEALDCPVIAEGRYRTAEDMRAALARGAYAVVIGTAITNPTAITRRILRR